MDAKGDHGGDGLLETSSAMWIYSKGVPLAHPNPNVVGRDLLTFTTFPGSSTAHRSVHQIDLVPTLSLLLGLPIPFNNLGTAIPELFTYRPNARGSPHASLSLGGTAPSPSGRTSWWGASSDATGSKRNPDPGDGSLHTLRTATRYNAEQIMAYLQAYRVSGSGAELDSSWDSLRGAFSQSINIVDGTSDGDAIAKNVAFTRLSLGVCRNLWAQFNAPRMIVGLVLLGVGLLTVSSAYFNLAHFRMDWERAAREIVLRGWYGVIVGAIGSAAGLALGIPKPWWTASLETGDVILASAAFVSQILVLITLMPTLLRTVRASHTSQTRWTPVANTLLPILLLVLHGMSFTSNSFILWEDRLVPFFLVTITMLTILSSLSAPVLRTRLVVFSLIISGAIRLISVSTVCREEQHPYCSVTFYASATRPLTPLPVVLAVLPLGLGLPWVVRRAFLTRSMSDKGPARFALETIWRVALLGGSTYWIVEWCESVFGDIDSPEGESRTAQGWLVASLAGRTVLARIVLGGTLVGAYVFWWTSPLSIEIKVEDSAPGSGKKRTVTVLGFANAYGSAYLLFILPFFAVLWAATQLSGQVVLALGLGAVLCYLEVVDSQRDARAVVTSFESASSPDAALDAVAEVNYDSSAVQHARSPTLAEPVFLGLLGHLLFFGSGHQAVLSSIQWKTAFVGFPVLTYPWSPALVSLNTFGPFILPALCLPLFATWAVSPVQPAQVGKAKTLVLADAVRLTLGMQLYYTALLFGTASSTAILRRHLMVWKVFAPRFMLAGVTVLAVDAALALGLFVGLARVNKKVAAAFGKQM
jgi:phosphatidylinositol glycan class O